MLPGNPYAWQKGYCPPGAGRPKKDAWVRELQRQLEAEPEITKALARKVLKIALGDDSKAALRALDMIQDRIGGPVIQRLQAEVAETVVREIVVVGTKAEAPALPPEVLAIEEARLAAEERAQVGRAGEGAKGD